MKAVSLFLSLIFTILLAVGPANAAEKAQTPETISSTTPASSPKGDATRSAQTDIQQAQCMESAGLSKTKRVSAAKAMVRCGDDGNCWRCKCCSNLKWPECCARCQK